MHRVADIAGYSTMEVFSDPEHADGLSELTIALDLKGARRLDMEPARCDDPNCMADHGYTGTSYPDDLTFRRPPTDRTRWTRPSNSSITWPA